MKPPETLSLKYVPLSDLLSSFWDANPKRHDIGAIAQSIQKHGFRDPLGWDKQLNGGKGGISEGNGRLEALQSLFEQGQKPPRGIALESDRWCVPVLFGVDADSELAAQAYGIDHNSLTMMGAEFTAVDLSKLYQPDAYLGILEDLAQADLMPISVDGDDLDFFLSQQECPTDGQGTSRTEDPPEDQPPVDANLPAVVFPTDNDWGIPLLLSRHQAEQFSTPFQPWGMKARTTTFAAGTLHFYVDDSRFTAVWNDPNKVVNASPYAVVEPNFTNSLESPKAYVLYNVFRKRWLSRYWQSQGLRIFVDLNVPVEFKDINFLGVPKDWRSFATRGYSDRLAATQLEYESACEYTGTEQLLFLVYGGGKKVQAACKERGWMWQPEQFDRVKGLVEDG